MKYPSDVSTTRPWFTAQMYVPQLAEIRNAAAINGHRLRGSRSRAFTRPNFRSTTTRIAIVTSDHSTRWASSSTALEWSSSFQ